MVESRTESGNERLTASESLWKRAQKVIPGGTQTFSKAPNQVAPGFAPKFLRSGRGSRVTDVDGHSYLDLTMGLLPVILGYCHEGVNEAVRRQLAEGSIFSLPHPLEVEVADQLADIIPCAEMIRFAKNGSDATSGAVRIARAYTDRDVVACCGYHGWQDWYIGSTTRSKGVPGAVKELTKTFSYNDLDSLRDILEAHPGGVAAIILEPVTFEPPTPGFLEGVRALATENGAVLIFDEVITGFRFAIGGAQELFGVMPDLSTFGKSVANGFPLSGIAGRRELMKVLEKAFFSFTFGGETLSLAAAQATVTELVERDGPSYLWDIGRQLKGGVESLIRSHELGAQLTCPGLPIWTCLNFIGPDPLGHKTLFQKECVERGVLFMSNHNTSLAHSTEDIDLVLSVYDEAMGVLAKAIADDRVEHLIEGRRVQPVFRPFDLEDV